MTTENCRVKSRFSKFTGNTLGATLLVCACVQACFTKEPSREETPTPASSSAPPSPAPPAPSAESEKKEMAPEQSNGGSARDLGDPGNRAPSPVAAPSAPPRAQAPAKARARSAPKAAAEGAPSDADDALENERAPSAPRELMQRLSDAYRGGSPDCPSAQSRKKAVCDLATQICQLMDRDPNVASVAEYCEDAKQRCSEAQRRTAERCER